MEVKLQIVTDLKKYPDAPKPSVEPIIYYLDNGTPEPMGLIN